MKITVTFPALNSSDKIRFTKTITLQPVASDDESEKLITRLEEEEKEAEE